MKLVVNIQLKPSEEQAVALRSTLERCNAACNWLAERATEAGTTKQFTLHKLCYKEVRERFGLTAQAAVRCIAKVADAFKAGKAGKRSFRRHAAQPYDDRIFRFRDDASVSIWTVEGRMTIPFACGDRQRALLGRRKGEVDLMLVRGKWYVAVVCDIPDPDEIDFEDVLGVDLGVVNLAFDSDGVGYSGAAVEANRRAHAHRRRNLQRKRTKSARRKLKKIRGKQARYQKDVNHCISKAIVEKAQRSGWAIALEDLKGISGRVKASRRQRSRLYNWAFAQLRSFIEYKARLLGIPVIPVDPRNTSRQCPECGRIDKKNRKSQAEFSCRECNHAGIADHIAARNIRIRARALVKVPNAGSA